jgi:Ras-related protein Rab-11A
VAAVLVYDVTKPESLMNAERRWLNEIRDNAPSDVITMLVGNKIDLVNLRCVSTDEGQQIANKHSLLFFETSALDATNVKTAFETIATEVYKKKTNQTGSNVTVSITHEDPLSLDKPSSSNSSSKKCC